MLAYPYTVDSNPTDTVTHEHSHMAMVSEQRYSVLVLVLVTVLVLERAPEIQLYAPSTQVHNDQIHALLTCTGKRRV
jgi:hypothetical protein